MIKRFLLVAAVSTMAAACGDSTSPLGFLSGSVGFSYTGALSGNFNASGTLPTGGNFETATWAAGERDNTDQAIYVAASTPRTSSTHDLVIVSIPRLTTGTETISASCTANVCAEVVVLLGNSNSTLDVQQQCALTSGSVVISSISASRAAGTFSGSGTCLSSVGTPSNFSITGGTFDVALVAALP